ncbi:MAG: cell division topological specificity factor MinE [Panacagrimonas sp.]
MDWLGFFRTNKQPSAQTARDRLMMVVAVQRDQDGRSDGGDSAAPSYLPQLRQELLDVVRKYVEVADSAVQVKMQHEGGLEVLEMNIALNEGVRAN